MVTLNTNIINLYRFNFLLYLAFQTVIPVNVREVYTGEHELMPG